MRSIHADLISAQQSGANEPYIYISINSVDYSSRLMQLEYIEESYRDTATIVLDNSDRNFDDIDLKGRSFSIGFGYVTSSGNRYCGDGSSGAMPNLWVMSQSLVTEEGNVVCILECEGPWSKMRRSHFIYTAKGIAQPYLDFTAEDTVFALIRAVLTEAGFTLNALTQDDGIINDFNPIVTINPFSYYSPAVILYHLIQMTRSYLRAVEGDAFEVVFPQSTDVVNEHYYSDEAPFFRSYISRSNLLVPNHIVVFANKDLINNKWNSDTMKVGHARDSDQFTGVNYTGQYEEVIEYVLAPNISDQLDANDRALAILERYKGETLSGRLVLPYHDCRVELYDRVEITDTRATPTVHEYYNPEDYNEFGELEGNTWSGQTFTPSLPHTILSVKLLLNRSVGGTPGTITVGIRATDANGAPTGPDLCSGTTNGNTLPSWPPEWREITFDTSYNLKAGVLYAILPRITGLNNPVRWRRRNPGLYTSGGSVDSGNGGATWTVSAGVDYCFEDLGEQGALFPLDPTIRVTSLVHRYGRGQYSLELFLGEVTAIFEPIGIEGSMGAYASEGKQIVDKALEEISDVLKARQANTERRKRLGEGTQPSREFFKGIPLSPPEEEKEPSIRGKVDWLRYSKLGKSK